ncbi:MAG TPA: hypothetical protein VGF94_14295 [Kofleriaceae bacterium]
MFGGIALVMAVGLSVWVGIHYQAPEWLAIYGSAAVASAALPAHRFVGAIALAVGLAVAVGSAVLLKDASLAPTDLVSPDGGVAAPAREAAVAAVTALWLVLGSILRLRRA